MLHNISQNQINLTKTSQVMPILRFLRPRHPTWNAHELFSYSRGLIRHQLMQPVLQGNSLLGDYMTLYKLIWGKIEKSTLTHRPPIATHDETKPKNQTKKVHFLNLFRRFLINYFLLRDFICPIGCTDHMFLDLDEHLEILFRFVYFFILLIFHNCWKYVLIFCGFLLNFRFVRMFLDLDENYVYFSILLIFHNCWKYVLILFFEIRF